MGAGRGILTKKRQASFVPWRFYLIIVSIILVILGLVGRLADLTIFDRHFLEHQGNLRVLRTVALPAFRGMITDRNGSPLAVSASVYSVWLDPQDFLLTDSNVHALANILGLAPKPLTASIQAAKNKKKEFLYLKRGIAPEVAAKVKALRLADVFLQEEYKRYYPEGEIAAHVVGFTNIDDKGQEGLELAYNQWLTGTSGKKLVIKDRYGRTIEDVKTLQQQHPGSELTLSIDRRIQYLAYRELAEGLQKNLAKEGTAIVLDTKTGEVLAMVNLPSYNPNQRPNKRSSVFRNKAVTDVFEPGSTIKAFSIATALGSGLYTPETIIDTSPGWMRVDRRVVRDEHNNGPIDVARIMQVSSNVGVTKMMLTLPPAQLWQVLHQVGFGESTNIGFPGEQAGVLENRPKWSPFMLATLSFGYGISATPLQLAQAYMIFANNGVKKPLSLLKIDHEPQGKQVITPKLAQQMLQLMESVTTAKNATGLLAKVPGFRVAGKTGTALLAGEHGYKVKRYISSFVGMAPVSKPRLLVAVIVHEPGGKNYYASLISAPIFQKIMEGALRILNVPPDDNDNRQIA